MIYGMNCRRRDFLIGHNVTFCVELYLTQRSSEVEWDSATGVWGPLIAVWI